MSEKRAGFNFSINDAMELATKKAGVDGWKTYQWESMDGGSLITGCVPAGVFERGPRKGQPRFQHPDAHSRKKVVVSDSELEAAAIEYERDGACWDCKGTGCVWAGWSLVEGVKYRGCRRCEGSGKRKP